MKAYDEIWGLAEDNFGIITSAQAKELGVSRQNIKKMEKSGRLMRLSHGVNDVYAVGVAVAGSKSYLRGASVIALLNLVPTDPTYVYVGAENRVRRSFPEGYIVKDMAKATTTFYEGIRCQTLVDALRDARLEGVIEGDRIYAAALKANEKGLLADEECSQFKD